jgi:DNA gyrase inhibitor GyrI
MAAPEVKFTTASRLLVASLERRGPYSGIGETMRSLKAWIDARGMEQAGYPFCLFYDNPKETAEADLHSEACIPVSKPFEPEGDFRLKEFAPVQVAETRQLGPPGDFSSTYEPFLKGLLTMGYRAVGPAREYFMTVSDVRGPGSGFLIRQPIAKT